MRIISLPNASPFEPKATRPNPRLSGKNGHHAHQIEFSGIPYAVELLRLALQPMGLCARHLPTLAEERGWSLASAIQSVADLRLRGVLAEPEPGQCPAITVEGSTRELILGGAA